MMTMLEAQVDEGRVSALVDSYTADPDSLPPAIVESFLIRELDTDRWRIVTLWASREALDEYQASVDTPGGVLMFRSAGAEPSLTVSEVSAHLFHK